MRCTSTGNSPQSCQNRLMRLNESRHIEHVFFHMQPLAHAGRLFRNCDRTRALIGRTLQTAPPPMRYPSIVNAGPRVGGSMSLREQLHAYIAQLEQRLRWSTVLRGLAILTGGALVATLVLVTIANALAFSQGSVTAARFALILILAIAAAAGLALPLRRLTRRRAVGTAEAAFPQFQQRLTTFAERDGQDPFIELLAGDTLEVAQSAEPKQMVTDRRLWISLATGVGAFAVLIWMIAAGPGFLGYGASLLWTGPHRDKPALYDLRVTPGDAVVRRHADQMVSALPTGLRVAQRQVVCPLSELLQVGRDCDAAQGGRQFRRRLSISICRFARERRVLCHRRSDDVEAL